MSAPPVTAAVLDAGAVVPAAFVAGDEPRLDDVEARRYHHPALGDRPVIRLVGSTVAPAEDGALGFLGFDAPISHPVVGVGRRRGLGFPAWVLVNQPQHARRALAAVKDFERAARQAASKPGNAKDAFEQLAAGFDDIPSVLPSLFEQAGRAFLAGGNARQAATMFEKARDVERTYGLPVDEQARRDVFLEFAFAGALNVRSLTAYAAALRSRYDPAEAYEAFFELLVRRTLGGLPPWTGSAKELRSLAKAAGLDAAAEDRRTLTALVGAPATSRAPEGFFKPYKAALVALFDADPELAAAGRELFPQAGSNAFFGWWLDVLVAGGALRPLTDGTAAPGTAARWLSQAITHCRRSWRSDQPPAQLFGIIGQLAEQIRTDGVVVTPQSRTLEVDANVLDALLEHGLPVARGGRIDLAGWRGSAADGIQRELGHLTADPAFDRPLHAAVTAYTDWYRADRKVDDLLTSPALAPFVAAWLQEQADGLGDHGLAGAGARVEALARATGRDTFDANPSAHAVLAATTMDGPLARTLAGGIVDELGWPALDEAAAQLNAGEARWSSAWPGIVVLDDKRAVMAGPEGIEAAHDLRIPTAVRWAFPSARYVDGQFLVTYRDREEHGYWSGRPGDVFTASINSYASVETCLTNEDGARFAGSRPLQVGDHRVDEERPVVSDGASAWRLESQTGADVDGRWRTTHHLREVDPRSGSTGRRSLPTWFEEFAPMAGEVDLAGSSLLPAAGLADSPLGLHDGMVGTRVRRRRLDDGTWVMDVESIDGRSATISQEGVGRVTTVFGLVRFPGLDEPVLLTQTGLWDSTATFQLTPAASGDQRSSTRTTHSYHYRHDFDERWAARGTPFLPPPRLWHALRPRDPAGSLALRRVDEAMARRLLDAATTDLAADAGADTMAATRRTIAEVLPAVSHPRLVDGVVGVVSGAARVQTELRSFVATRAPSGRAAPVGPDPSEVTDADLGVLGNVGLGVGHYSYGGRETGRPGLQLSSVAQYLAGELEADVLVSDFPTTSVPWPALVGRVGVLAFLAASPAVDDGAREGLLRFLEIWATTPFVGDLDGIRVGRVTGVEPCAGEDKDKRKGKAKGLGFGRSRPQRRYVVLPSSSHLFTGRQEYWYLSATGAAPPGSTEIEALDLGSDRTAEQILALVATARERGPVPVTDDAIDRLRERTGMSRAEAALLLGGLPNIGGWEANFIDAPTRAALGGLKLAEAKVGREALKGLPSSTRIALVDAGAGRTPEDRWTPTVEGGPVDEMAAVWNALVGRRVAVPDGALVDAKAVPSDLPAATWLPLLADPTTDGPLHTDGRWRLEAGTWQEVLTCTRDDAFGWDHAVLLAHAIPWAFGRPVGDPLRAQLGTVLELVRARLANRQLLVPLRSCWCGADDPEAILANLGARAAGTGNRQHDTGQLVVTTVSEYHRVSAYLRPAHLDDGPIDPLVLAIHWPHGNVGDPLHVVERLRDRTYDAFVDRVAATPVPVGGYEADPGASAPDLVATVADTLGVSPDAAALHLQLLTLLDPTDRNVRTWNGWTPARHKKAQAELVSVGVVTEAKRERAGRSAFVAGGWVKVAAPDLPVETWKLAMYDSHVGDDGKVRPHLRRLLPLRPYHELFEQAWSRVAAGDAPGATS